MPQVVFSIRKTDLERIRIYVKSALRLIEEYGAFDGHPEQQEMHEFILDCVGDLEFAVSLLKEHDLGQSRNA